MMEPIDRILKGAKLDARYKAALRAVLSNGIWTLDRKFDAGFTETDVCPLCPEGEGPSRCSFLHLAWSCQCPKIVDLRNTMGTQDLCDRALGEANTTPLWTRAIAWIPEMFGNEIGTEADFIFVTIDNSTLGINAFVDGSGLHPKSASLRRCGWAFSLVMEDGRVLRHGYGPLPKSVKVQTVPASELYALFQVLRVCAGGTRIHSDCDYVVKGFALGLRAHRGSHLRSLWTQVFAENARAMATVVKVKAHTTEEDVRTGKIDAEVREANNYVVRLAKQGAAIHDIEREYLCEFKNIQSRVELVAPYLANLVALTSSLCSAPGRQRAHRKNKILSQKTYFGRSNSP
jgi:hypothetical protein